MNLFPSSQVLTPWDNEPIDSLQYIASLEKIGITPTPKQKLSRVNSASTIQPIKTPTASYKFRNRPSSKLTVSSPITQGEHSKESDARIKSYRLQDVQKPLDQGNIGTFEKDALLITKAYSASTMQSPREIIHKKVPTKMKYQKLMTMIRKGKDDPPKRKNSFIGNYNPIQDLIASLQQTNATPKTKTSPKAIRKLSKQVEVEIISHPRHGIFAEPDKKTQINPFSQRIGKYIEQSTARPSSPAVSTSKQKVTSINSFIVSTQNTTGNIATV